MGSTLPLRHSTNQLGQTEYAVEEASGELQWWQRAVFYEIAPISFQDSNGDGQGDLPGLIARVDYLEWLGIDAVWLTPIYRSPMLDLGYDISDFCAVDRLFGTLEDFDRLLAVLHERQIRLIIDFVPNHTSDQHRWFQESRSSRANPKRDWYIWADGGTDGGPPNNWLSRFGGSAWQWDNGTGQYYYHSFLAEQPDLNWRKTEVRHAMGDVLRFWLQRGVDGFRVDASAVLIEDELLRDDPPDPAATSKTPPPQRLKRVFTDDRRESMGCLEEIRQIIDEFPERVLAGEVQGKTDRIGHFYGAERPRFHLPLNFLLLDTPWDALSLQANIDAYLNAIPQAAWPDWVVGGHDKPRVASKIGQAQARILAMLLLTLPGTPFFFAGDELGMEEGSIPKDRIQDPFEKLVPGYGLNRDPQRTPMQWDESHAAGFTAGNPWLPVGRDARDRNVASFQKDPGSILWLYRRLIHLRRSEPSFTRGEYIPLKSEHGVLLYKRVWVGRETLIALNLMPDPRRLERDTVGTLRLSTYSDRDADSGVNDRLLLRGDEGVIITLAKR
jgi:alpha-glucosidase